VVRSRNEELLLGEWAVLGILANGPAHGFAVAKQLAAEGEVGRVWALSRPLTYRAIDQLLERGLIEAVGEEPGRAGGPRTIYSPTAVGRSRLRRWLAEPASHLRDVRTELLLKLVLCDLATIDPGPLIRSQRAVSEPVAHKWSGEAGRHRADPVTLWRAESSRAVVRFLNRFATARGLEP
jgi:DNA-binding PadR family transcriptional regulator